MNLTLTEDQEIIQEAAKKFLKARAATAGIRTMSQDPIGFSPTLWNELVEQGWTGLALPEAYGGSGAGFLEACLLVEQLAWHAIPTPFLCTLLGGLAISRFGSLDQKEDCLRSIGRGRIVTYARTSWGTTESTVLATRSGDQFRLDGSALFTPFAHVARDLLVVAQRDTGQLTVFLVEANSPGIVRTPVETVGSDRPHHVELSQVLVPENRILGEIDQGATVVQALTAWGTAATAVHMVGGAQKVLDLTVEYARQRQQFGRPIGSFQAVQHHCADMAIDVLSARFLAYEAVWRLSEGLSADTEVSMAKAWVSAAYRRVTALGHQVHGAMGFTKDHDLHFFLREALASSLQYGDSDFHWDRVASNLGL